MHFDRRNKPATRCSRQLVSGVTLAVFALASLGACAKKDATPAADSAGITPAAPPNVSGTKVDPAIGTVTEYGFDQLRAGMTFTAANEALKGALKADAKTNLAECNYVKWDGGPSGMLVMVLENKIARVDVTDSSTVPTSTGAKIGDTEERIQSLYPGRVAVTPHKYTDGHYLTVKAANAADSLNFIIFETEKNKVTRYRAGVMPGVAFIEGCS